LESLCCGLPVICSRVGGLPEVIDDKNGILVEKDNVQALAAAMIQMMESYATYDRKQISENASTLFNYDVVGKQYEAIYKKVLIQHQSNRL
jgi:glycosyltransferase involved in cell wall biosynthesis